MFTSFTVPPNLLLQNTTYITLIIWKDGEEGEGKSRRGGGERRGRKRKGEEKEGGGEGRGRRRKGEKEGSKGKRVEGDDRIMGGGEGHSVFFFNTWNKKAFAAIFQVHVPRCWIAEVTYLTE